MKNRLSSFDMCYNFSDKNRIDNYYPGKIEGNTAYID